MSKAFVQRLLKQKKLTGHVQPQKQGGRMRSQMQEYSTQIVQMVENYPDLTLGEYCEYWGETYGLWISTSTMDFTIRGLIGLGLFSFSSHH